MKYTAEEVRARVGFVISDREPRILTWESGGCHPASIAECAIWDALAERIKADEEVEPTEAVLNKAVEVFLSVAPEWNDYLVKDGMRAALLTVWPNPPAQAAQSVDIGAIREVIESHINEAKKLRHDPESQDYLYEQADKLEAALQEKGNG